MASKKITEVDVASEIKEEANVLITQEETDENGNDIESLRRIPYKTVTAELSKKVGYKGTLTTSGNDGDWYGLFRLGWTVGDMYVIGADISGYQDSYTSGIVTFSPALKEGDIIIATADSPENLNEMLSGNYFNFKDYFKHIPVGGSNAEVVDTLPTTGDKNADYYLKNSDGTYTHYRYIDSAWVAVGGDSYTKAEIDSLSEDNVQFKGNLDANWYITSDDETINGKILFDCIDLVKRGWLFWASDGCSRTLPISKTNTTSGELKLEYGDFVLATDDCPNYVSAWLYLFNKTDKASIDTLQSEITTLQSSKVENGAETGEFQAEGNITVVSGGNGIKDSGVALTDLQSDVSAASEAAGESKTAADKAQGDVDALKTVVNTLNPITNIKVTNGVMTVEDREGNIKDYDVGSTETTVKVWTLSGTAVTVEYTNDTQQTYELPVGSGSSTAGSLVLSRQGSATIQCLYGSAATVALSMKAKDSAGELVGNGTADIYVGGVLKKSGVTVYNQTDDDTPIYTTIDVSEYLAIGSNTVKITVTVDTGDESPATQSKTWTVNAISMRLEWPYEDATINKSDAALVFTPYGDVEKTIHIVVDDEDEITMTTTSSGVQQSYSLSMRSHGAHSVKMYMTATIDGEEISTDAIYHDVIFDAGEETTIIAISYLGGEVTQYSTLAIPVVIYNPSSLTSDAVLKVNGEETATWTDVDRTAHTWNYTANTAGETVLSVESGGAYRSVSLSVTALDINNKEVEGYDFRLKASDYSGNNALIERGDIEFSDGFDWVNGGLQSETDDSGNVRQYICVKAGNTMTLKYQPFATDAKDKGKTLKIIYKAVNCRKYDAQVLSCTDASGIGLEMNAQTGTLTSNAQSIDVPYCESTYMELEFDIYPITEDGTALYIRTWLDGVPCGIAKYASNESFTQTDPQYITVGSEECDVYIYMVKGYPSYLTEESHLVNFIADAPSPAEMLARYNRNNILGESGDIDYKLLAEKNPDVRVDCIDMPRMSKTKKDGVESTFYEYRDGNGTTPYLYSPESGAKIYLQGTSSLNYIVAALNLDMVPTSLIDMDGEAHTGYVLEDGFLEINRANIKVNVASCEGANNACNVEWYNRFQPYIRPYRAAHDYVRDCMKFYPSVTFIKDNNTKAYGSTADLYEDSNVFFDTENYISSPYYKQYAVSNIGTSKKNTDTFHDPDNLKEVVVEVSNNTSPQCLMTTKISADMADAEGTFAVGDGTDKTTVFEFRYYNENADVAELVEAWVDFVNWMAACNPKGATEAALPDPVTYGAYTFKGCSDYNPDAEDVLKGLTISTYAGTYTKDTKEYRMAKMLSECEDHMIMDSVTFHYLFLERHTALDNVAKNTSWGSEDLEHWHLCMHYDCDTADGNNNTGKLKLTYGIECTDVDETGVSYFNGAGAVWFVFLQGLYEARRKMFIYLDAKGAWTASTYLALFKEFQAAIPERCWIYDYHRKYIRPDELGLDGTGFYMDMMEGGLKTHQRAQYETYQEPYMRSEYANIDATGDTTMVRGNTPNKDNMTDEEKEAWVKENNHVTLTMYADCYVVVKAVSGLYSARAKRGVATTVDFAGIGAMGDAEIYFYTASMIQEIGDLTHLYISEADFSAAKRLQSITVSSDRLTSLGFGDNPMLEYIYAPNNPNVTGALKLDKLTALKYIDLRGSGFSGVVFADGAPLEEAHLTAVSSLTMKNLSKLTEDKFSLEGYDKLTDLIIEYCPSIDTLNIVTLATALVWCRLLGVSWTTSTALLDRLLGIGGINEKGIQTAQSVLTGEAWVPSITATRRSKYEAAWNELTISADTTLAEYEYHFVDYDGTPLKDKSGNEYIQYVEVGTEAYDPVAAGEMDAPTREQSESTVYAFSGWKNLSGNASASRTVTAEYSESTRQYTVNWWKSRTSDGTLKTPLETQTVDYCGEAVYSGDRPTYTDDEYAYIYRLFHGWDKSTGCVRGDIDVVAQWTEGTYSESDGITSIEEMNAAQIYGCVQRGDIKNFVEAQDRVSFKMGFSPEFTNVEYTDVITEPKTFDGATCYDTGLTPLAEDESWVMAIDAELTNTSGTLICCFEDSGSVGFILRYSGGMNLKYGGTTYTVPNAGVYREMLVLRHIAGDSSLYVYTSNHFTGLSVNKTTLTKSSGDTTTKAPLVLGAAKYLDGAAEDGTYSTGTVYSMRIWHDDLGEDNCKKLAAWPGETHTVEATTYTSIDGGAEGLGAYAQMESTDDDAEQVKDSDGYNKTTSLDFAYAHLLDRTRNMNSTSTNTGGIKEAALQKWMEARVITAMPEEWQQMIVPCRVKYNCYVDGSSTDVESFNTKISPLSVVEVGGSKASPWMDEMTYDSKKAISYFTSNAKRIKFKSVVIPTDAAFYTSATDPVNEYAVKEGDVWINTSNSSIGYIRHNGAWQSANYWWLRGASVTRSTNFTDVNYSGSVSTGGDGATGTNGVCPRFSI